VSPEFELKVAIIAITRGARHDVQPFRPGVQRLTMGRVRASSASLFCWLVFRRLAAAQCIQGLALATDPLHREPDHVFMASGKPDVHQPVPKYPQNPVALRTAPVQTLHPLSPSALLFQWALRERELGLCPSS
jgi:hypothetical protein